MASIYDQSTHIGTGRFAPSVQYNAVAKASSIVDIEIPKMSDGEVIDINLQPIAEAFMNSENNEAKLKMAELEHEFNLRKLEAEKEKKKKEEKDYSVLKDLSLNLSDLEASAKNMSPTEYQAQHKRIVDNALKLYNGSPKDVFNVASSASWGYKEEIIANRKDQSAWVQDQRQNRIEELAKDNAWLRSQDPENAAYFVDNLNSALNMINQATAIENDPNASEADKTIAKQTKQQYAVTIAANLWQGLFGSGEIDPSTFSNEANYLEALDLVARRVSAATGMSYGAAKLAAKLAGDNVGVTDMTNDSMKKFAANVKYTEDSNKYIIAQQKAQLYNIPGIRVLESVSPELRDQMLNDPNARSFYDGLIKEYLLDFAFDESTGDVTLKLLGNMEKLSKQQAGERPSYTLGRQHTATYLDIAKDQVAVGNRNLNRSPYADYHWYMGVNAIQATLAHQAITAKTSEDLNTVVANVNNADQLINNPTAQAKKASIEANNPRNPIAQGQVKADKDMNIIIKGMLTLKNKLPEKDVNTLLQNANYFRTSISAGRLRLDEKTGEVKVLEDAKGFIETIGAINEANVIQNVKDFNNKTLNIKNLNDRLAIVKYLTATPENGIIKPLQEGDVVQDEAGVLATVATDLTTLIGVGVDTMVQPLEYGRQKQTEPMRQSSANAELRVQPVVPPTASMTDFDKYPLQKNKDGSVSNVKTEIVGREVNGKELEFVVPTMGDTSKHFGGYASVEEAKKADEQMHKELADKIAVQQAIALDRAPKNSNTIHFSTENPNKLDVDLVKIVDDDKGIEYNYDRVSGKQHFQVDDIVYNGTADLFKTPIKKITRKEEDGMVVLEPGLGVYTDKGADYMEQAVKELQELLGKINVQ